MSSVVLALGGLSFVYAGWMRFLGRRAAHGVLRRNAPGIRLPATKVCEHTWAAALAVAAPQYTMLAAAFLGIGALTVLLGLLGVTEGVALVVWLVLAIGVQVTVLSKTGRDATVAVAAVRCEHQGPPATERPYRPRPDNKPRARGGRGKGGKRR
jgi:hypothetical protein